LTIFEKVCQTVAHAHARGIIHRDLKPSNIMVGDFGEVLVMDWGLAKELPGRGAAGAVEGPPRGPTDPATETTTLSARSRPGTVLGTPAYMAPEQARGEIELVDRRADVFGLGAILFEILTGRPPYTGSARIVRMKAAEGDLANAPDLVG
jgi:serine/threonine-protein kinase